ncbi:hypothetical protein EYC84_010434 [Monilinia fructicola]|uniref:Uncharacterized protein n=1 Tax=Monilinia fructicola TaxID=38448 RepID=A0A5M9JI61_MONFR|nr:hypothetical protein EYC84_010434 [Monilinia fructicola]
MWNLEIDCFYNDDTPTITNSRTRSSIFHTIPQTPISTRPHPGNLRPRSQGSGKSPQRYSSPFKHRPPTQLISIAAPTPYPQPCFRPTVDQAQVIGERNIESAPLPSLPIHQRLYIDIIQHPPFRKEPPTFSVPFRSAACKISLYLPLLLFTRQNPSLTQKPIPNRESSRIR